MYASQSIFVSAIPKCTKVWWQRKKNLWSVMTCPPYCLQSENFHKNVLRDVTWFSKDLASAQGIKKMKLVASIRGNCKKNHILGSLQLYKNFKKEKNTSMFRITPVGRWNNHEDVNAHAIDWCQTTSETLSIEIEHNSLSLLGKVKEF